MSLTVAVHTTTFRPEIDRWMAADGADVVLRADGVEAWILRFCDGHWVVSRNLLADESDSDPIDYLGDHYCRDGEPLAEFRADTPLSEWERVYAGCYGR